MDERTKLRLALVCLPAAGEAPLPLMAGRSAAMAQVALALAAGCKQVVVHAHGVSPEAIALRHLAEAGGARFHTITEAGALVGLAGADDELLVFAPGVWPAARDVLAEVTGTPRVLVFAAGPGMAAGLERIDLARAWAGVMVIPGGLLPSLAALPVDTAPASALLRIGLQNGLPYADLPEAWLNDGGWGLPRQPQAALGFEQEWLGRVLGKMAGGAVCARLARAALLARGGALLAQPHGIAGAAAATAAMLGSAVAAAWHEYPVAAFALFALAAFAFELCRSLGLVRSALDWSGAGKLAGWARRLRDGVLAGCGVLAICGFWPDAVFAPGVLLAGLLLLDHGPAAERWAALRDRGVLGAALAALAALLGSHGAVMLIAAALLGANLLRTAPARVAGRSNSRGEPIG